MDLVNSLLSAVLWLVQIATAMIILVYTFRHERDQIPQEPGDRAHPPAPERNGSRESDPLTGEQGQQQMTE